MKPLLFSIFIYDRFRAILVIVTVHSISFFRVVNIKHYVNSNKMVGNVTLTFTSHKVE